MKIAILGYSGSGKSTLAGQLARYYGVPVLYLDTVQFLPGWKERSPEEGRAAVAAFLRDSDAWVIDGNYGKFMKEERLRQADRILILLFPRALCLYRVLKRYFRCRGKTRASMAEGCPEKIDAEFVRWVLYEGRTRKRRAWYREIASLYPEKTQILKRPSQVRDFLARTLER